MPLIPRCASGVLAVSGLFYAAALTEDSEESALFVKYVEISDDDIEQFMNEIDQKDVAEFNSSEYNDFVEKHDHKKVHEVAGAAYDEWVNLYERSAAAGSDMVDTKFVSKEAQPAATETKAATSQQQQQLAVPAKPEANATSLVAATGKVEESSSREQPAASAKPEATATSLVAAADQAEASSEHEQVAAPATPEATAASLVAAASNAEATKLEEVAALQVPTGDVLKDGLNLAITQDEVQTDHPYDDWVKQHDHKSVQNLHSPGYEEWVKHYEAKSAAPPVSALEDATSGMQAVSAYVDATDSPEGRNKLRGPSDPVAQAEVAIGGDGRLLRRRQPLPSRGGKALVDTSNLMQMMMDFHHRVR